MGVRDHQQPWRRLSEDQQAVREHDHRVGQLLVVGGQGREPLDVPDHVVGQEPHRPALEARQPGHGNRLELGEQIAKCREGIRARQKLDGPVGPPDADALALGREGP
jgi:hypothetical protein